MPTIILPCKCVHTFQDRVYGLHNRVHNLCKHGTKANDACRCTVCGNVQPLTKAAAEQEQK